MSRLFTVSLKALAAAAILATGATAADAASTRTQPLMFQAVPMNQQLTAGPALRSAPAAPPTIGRFFNGPPPAGQPPIASVGGLSNGAGSPDLVILPRYAGSSGMPQTGFCGPWNGGNPEVWFYVQNVGSSTAPVSDVYVGFGGSNYTVFTIPALAPNQKALRSESIPADAWPQFANQPSVQLLVAADHNDAMSEVSETNNYGQGTCLGPAS